MGIDQGPPLNFILIKFSAGKNGNHTTAVQYVGYICISICIYTD